MHAAASPEPFSCAACHGEIARTKAASRHATIPCTRCHNVPEAHSEAPRVNPASKPTTRELCGECHAKGAASSETNAPQVDLSQHGQRFLCWQCHYPHSPEVR